MGVEEPNVESVLIAGSENLDVDCWYEKLKGKK